MGVTGKRRERGVPCHEKNQRVKKTEEGGTRERGDMGLREKEGETAVMKGKSKSKEEVFPKCPTGNQRGGNRTFKSDTRRKGGRGPGEGGEKDSQKKACGRIRQKIQSMRGRWVYSKNWRSWVKPKQVT